MMASCDIPCQRPLMAFQQEPLRFGSHPLSLELLYACHIELAWLEDVALGKMYDAKISDLVCTVADRL